jgi:hypothetical protein
VILEVGQVGSVAQQAFFRQTQDPRLPSKKVTMRAGRRFRPLIDIFDAEIVPLLKEGPGLRPVAFFEKCFVGIPNFLPAHRCVSFGFYNGGPALSPRALYVSLTWFGLDHVHVILGGKCFIALAERLQNLLCSAGGVPQRHRSASISM